jgi:isoleucyl-tRNA synthetase
VSVRTEARKFALQAIDVQKDEFRKLGIMADWDAEGGVYRSLGEFCRSRRL